MQRLEYLVDHEPENLADITALGNVVNTYENDNGHQPLHPDSLIARIEREMYERRLNKGQLAALLGVPGSRLSEVSRANAASTSTLLSAYKNWGGPVKTDSTLR